MLDDYCNSLPDRAQVALSLRLIRTALPAWESYMAAHPDQVDAVNALIREEHFVKGGAHRIDPGLPRQALLDIEQKLAARVALINSPTMKGHMATIMEPLTNPAWDDVLPLSVRLVYTSVFNVLAFLLMHRFANEDESHIYVAINQACDAILREQFLSKDELENVLQEYKDYAPGSEGELLSADDQVKEDETHEELPLASVDAALQRFLRAVQRKNPHCPKCSSPDVRETGGFIEFTSMRCDACGYEDTMIDCWELDEWYA